MSEFGNLARYLDKLADDIDAQAEHVDWLADKIALLESQRDALLAACKEAKEWHEYEIDFGLLRLSVRDSVCEQIEKLAAAIAITEGKE